MYLRYLAYTKFATLSLTSFKLGAAGIVDDIFGVNFVQGTTSGDPYDDNGHGTFVAGVVGAVGNNGIGISGVAQVASIIGANRDQGQVLTMLYLPSSISSELHV